jgi:hypothetical protein
MNKTKGQSTLELTLSLTALIMLFAGMLGVFTWSSKNIVQRHNAYVNDFVHQYNVSTEFYTPEALDIVPDIASAYVSDIPGGIELMRTLGDIFQEGRSGEFYYNLLTEKGIIIKYGPTPGGVDGYWSAASNTIIVNELLWDNLTESGIAAIIVHEMNHADYTYNWQYWRDITLQENPGLLTCLVHIPGDSIDQEYRSYYNMAKAYEQLKAANGYNASMEDIVAMINAGEDFAKAKIAMTYPYLSAF